MLSLINACIASPINYKLESKYFALPKPLKITTEQTNALQSHFLRHKNMHKQCSFYVMVAATRRLRGLIYHGASYLSYVAILRVGLDIPMPRSRYLWNFSRCFGSMPIFQILIPNKQQLLLFLAKTELLR